MRNFFKRKIKPHVIELYDSITELPMDNWREIHKKKDYTYLKKNRINGQMTKDEFQILQKQWEKLFDQYITQFGFSENFLNIHQKRKSIAMFKLNRLVNEDPSLDTMIEILEKELAVMIEEKTEDDFFLMKAHLDKQMGFQINLKTVTVAEFYSYISVVKSQKNG